MMSHPNNEKTEDTPPPYSEYQLYEEPDLLKPPSGPAPPPMGYGAVPPLPSQCPPYYSSPGVVGPSEGVLFHPPQAVFITPVQPTYVPDYLAYSIFTMLCCCVPLGIVAFVYSMLTRAAVGAGDTTVARTNSRRALFYANLAVLFGVMALIVYLLLKMTVAKRVD
ncbi:proline rich transmembrane protein 1B-like [Anolis sagrei]|uniref:proline rich transmembrane protein 1B-like n=1 Tax=Anolis sagrei TaxID=38937 RepID=UPI00295B3DA2|nr:proline rich transmembrane protein 1B-like [Anolis sagrei ordinatus]